jgi:hypothetical protein
LVIGEPDKQATFSNWRITNNNVFEQMLVFATFLNHL